MGRGKPRLPAPMLFALGFLPNFLVGGISGVFLASPPIDLHVHDTNYAVTHFHFVMLAALRLGLLAGLYFWFPKLFGRLLSERIGLDGMPRRIADHPTYAPPGWPP